MEYYVNAGRLRSLSETLEQWAKAHLKIFEQDKGKDCYWWYNERASISVLAGAAWMSGGRALEEFATRKGPKGKKRSGRADLYLELGHSYWTIEAKQTWPNIGPRCDPKKWWLEWWLGKACEDARENDSADGRRMGVLFVSPRIRLTQLEHLAECRDRLIARLADLDSHALAWVFPEGAHKIADKYSAYPGAAIVMRALKE